jgi:peptide/nickel transport system permease protein
MQSPEYTLPGPVGPAGPQPTGGEVTSTESGNLFISDILHNKRVISGCAVVLLLVLFCFLGPLLYHTNQTATNLNLENLPPGKGRPLGTDEYGIDILGRLMVGGQSSLELGFAVAISSTVIGALYGAISGMLGGIADAFLMRIVDTLLAVPTFILLLICASLFTLNLLTIITILALLSWPYVCRLVRAQVLALKEREFVQASTAMGSTKMRILMRHMVPNTFNIFIVTTTFAIADSIYALSALSFLGLGPPPPFADWGTMLTNGVNDLFDSYPWEVYPALVILVVTVIAFRQIGDALNDIASARSSRR